MEGLRYFDAHAHMSWYTDAAAAMDECGALGLAGLCCTVDAADFGRCPQRAEDDPWAIAAGLHPWWAGEADLEPAVEAAHNSRFIGEIGLDLGKKHSHTAAAQLKAFRAMCEAAPDDAILSIHSVTAADKVLDVLTETGALARCRCVFHWFSGTSDELRRAVAAGCWFSVGESSLATRRGREYARQIPQARILTETDLPEAPTTPIDAAVHLASLERAVEGIAAARKLSAEQARATLLENALSLVC